MCVTIQSIALQLLHPTTRTHEFISTNYIILLIYVGAMNSGAFANLYWNGNISTGVNGDIIFEGPLPVMVVIPLDCGIRELRQIMLRELKISSNQEIVVMKYRCPIEVGNPMKYTASALLEDSHVQLMLMMYANYSNWSIIEIYVETKYCENGCDNDMAHQTHHGVYLDIPYMPTQPLCTPLYDFESHQLASSQQFPHQPSLAGHVSQSTFGCQSDDGNIDINDDVEDSWQGDRRSDDECDVDPEFYSDDGLDDVDPEFHRGC